MRKESILLVEFITAGGFGPDQEHAGGLLIEGLGMLKALIRDALKGNFEVHACIIKDLVELVGNHGGRVQWHFPRVEEAFRDFITRIGNGVDHAFLVAPEVHHHSERVTRCMERAGVNVLSINSKDITWASSKFGSLEALSRKGVAIPETQYMQDFLDEPLIEYPVIMKPDTGTGCGGVVKVEKAGALHSHARALENSGFKLEDIIVQDFKKGLPCSASILTRKDTTCLIGINRQFVSLASNLSGKSRYAGGVIGPIAPPGLLAEIKAIATKISAFIESNGFFGFDFILDPDEGHPCVVEVNPRLTTPFIPLEMTLDASILQFLASDSSAPKVISNLIYHCSIHHYWKNRQHYKTIPRIGVLPDEGRYIFTSVRHGTGKMDALVIEVMNSSSLKWKL